MKNPNYHGRVIRYRLLIEHVRFSFLLKALFLLIIAYSLPESEIKAQAILIDGKKNPEKTPINIARKIHNVR